MTLFVAILKNVFFPKDAHHYRGHENACCFRGALNALIAVVLIPETSFPQVLHNRTQI